MIHHVLSGGLGLVLGAPSGKLIVFDDFDTLSPNWTWLLGSGAVVGGALRAATLTADGYNIIKNPEFTVNTANWQSYDTGILIRVDSTIDPGILSPGIDKWVLKVNAGVSQFGAAVINYAIRDVRYLQSCLAFAPSANPVLRAAWLNGWAGGPQVSAEDIWETLSVSMVAYDAYYPRLTPKSANNIAYFDSISSQAQLVLAYRADFRRLDGTFTAGMPMPAAGTTPRSLLFRVTDALNYWEVRVLPNTAGTDTLIVEHVAGVMTTRASADVDWTASQTDEIMVTVSGTAIAVYHRKFGAGVWTAACNYVTMATGLTADRHGLLLYQTGADQFTYWQAES